MHAAYLLQLALVPGAVDGSALQGRVNSAGGAQRSSRGLPVRRAAEKGLQGLLQQLLVLLRAWNVPLQSAQQLTEGGKAAEYLIC